MGISSFSVSLSYIFFSKFSSLIYRSTFSSYILTLWGHQSCTFLLFISVNKTQLLRERVECRALALHAVNPTLIPVPAYGFLSTARSHPRAQIQESSLDYSRCPLQNKQETKPKPTTTRSIAWVKFICISSYIPIFYNLCKKYRLVAYKSVIFYLYITQKLGSEKSPLLIILY